MNETIAFCVVLFFAAFLCGAISNDAKTTPRKRYVLLAVFSAIAGLASFLSVQHTQDLIAIARTCSPMEPIE